MDPSYDHLDRFMAQLPQFEIFTLQAWLEWLDAEALVRLERAFCRVLERNSAGDEAEAVRRLTRRVSDYESRFAYRHQGEIRFMLSKTSGHELELLLARLNATLGTEMFRRGGFLGVRAISLHPRDRIWFDFVDMLPRAPGPEVSRQAL